MPQGCEVRGTIVIVAFNGVDALRACLRSVAAENNGGEIACVVVDNSDSAEIGDLIQREFPFANLIISPKNLGFAGGNNLAMPHCKGGWRLFLNPDTELLAGSVNALESVLLNDKGIGCAAPAIVEKSGGVSRSYYPFTRPLVSIMRAFGMWKFLPINRRDGRWRLDFSAHSSPCLVECVLGAAMMIRREALEEVGVFDERFFLYSEEEDICRRLTKAGWRIVYTPAARVVHLGAVSTADNPLTVAAANLSRHLLLVKWHSFLAAQFSRWIWMILLGFRWIAAVVLGSRGKSKGYACSLRALIQPKWLERQVRPWRAES